MSKTIDQKIVSMQFDNSQFEKGVATSLKTIDKLKTSLNFDGIEDGLDNVGKSANKVDFSALASGIETVHTKFSAFEVMAITALSRITNKAIDAGEQLVKSLTIDQVSSGWDKYAEKTSAVQTIMAATADQFEDTDTQMEYVNDQLDKLNWFTDETSYNLVDMTSNIGKFTSAGVELDDAVNAMQGIATWAAVSGANTTEASRAMYNMSQAMGTGTVQVRDWMSIENANMATLEFKNTALETAASLGLLAKTEDGVYQTMQGTTVTAETFRDSLSDDWFTSEVLVQTLDEYGGFSTKLNEVYTALGDGVNYTTSEILEMIDDFQAGSLDLNDVVSQTGLTAEEVTSMLTELSSEEYSLGLKAFKAAQEAKTFEEAINATKDAVSSGWMNTFEIIFGDYEEAKKLWTGLANELYDVFAESGNARNEMLEAWAELGGRTDLLKGISNAWQGLKSILTTVKEAFREVFPATTAEQLYNFTKNFASFTERFKMSDDQLEKFKNTMVKVFTGLKGILTSLKNLIKGIVGIGSGLVNFFKSAGSLASTFFSILSWGIGIFSKFTAKLADLLNNFKNVWKGAKDTNDSVNELGFSTAKSSKLLDVLNTALSKIFGTFKKVTTGIKEFATNLKDSFKTNGLSTFITILSKVLNFVKKIGSAIVTLGKAIGTVIFDSLKNMSSEDFFTALNGGALLAILIKIRKVVKDSGGLIKSLTGIVDGAKSIFTNFSGIFSSVSGMFTNIGNSFKSFSGVLDSVKNTFKAYQLELDAKALLKIASAIAILVGSLVVLSLIDQSKLGPAIAAMTGMFADLVASLVILSKANTKVTSAAGVMAMLIGMSAAIMVLAIALKVISTIDPEALGSGIVGLTAVLVAMTAAAALLGAIGKYSKKMVSGSTALVILGVAALLMASVCKKMADVDTDAIKKTYGLMAGMLIFAAGIAAVGNYSKKMLNSAIALTIMGGAMNIAANICLKMKDADTESMSKAAYLAAGLLIFAAGMAAIGNYSKKMFNSAIALTIMGGAMAIVADVCLKLNEVKSDSLDKAGKLIYSMLLLAAGMAVVGNYSKKMLNSAIAMTIMSASLEIIADVCTRLDSVSWDGMTRAGLAMIGLVAMAGALAIVGGYSKKMINSAVAMAIIGAALESVADVCVKMNSVSWGGLARAGLAMAGLVAVAGYLAIIGNFSKKMINSAVAMVIMAYAMEKFADICTIFGQMEWKSLAKAGVAVAGIMALALAFTALSKKASGMIGAAAGLLAMGVALKVFVPILQALGGMSIVEIAKALGIMAAAFVVLGVAGKLLTPAIPGMLGAAGAMVLIGVAAVAIGAGLVLAAAGIAALAASISTAATSIVGTLAVVITETSGLVEYVIDQNEEVILKYCKSIIELVPAIKDAFVTICIAVIDVIKELLPAIITVLQDNVPSLFELLNTIMTNVFEFFDANMPKLFDTLQIFLDNLSALIQTNMPVWFEIIQQFLTNVFELVETNTPKLFEIVSIFIDNLLQLLMDKVPAIAETAVIMIEGFLQAINGHIGDITVTAIEIVLAFINGITQKLPDIIDAAFKLIVSFIDGLATAIDENADKLMDAVIHLFKSVINAAITVISGAWDAIKKAARDLMDSGFIKGIGDKLEEVKGKIGEVLSGMTQKIKNTWNDFKTAAKDLISKFIDGIGAKVTAVKDKIGELVGAAVQKVKDLWSDMKDAGGYLIEGMKDGITGALSSITNAVKDVAGDVVNAFKDFFHISSPSKVMKELGGYISEGAAIGIEDKAGMVTDATSEMADDAVDGAKAALAEMSKALNNDSDIVPTITPVIDMGSVDTANLKVGGSVDATISKPVNALSQIVTDAQNSINSSNNEVITAIASLRSELAEYYANKDQEISLYVDSSKLASSIAKPMNRQLNILSKREAYV